MFGLHLAAQNAPGHGTADPPPFPRLRELSAGLSCDGGGGAVARPECAGLAQLAPRLAAATVLHRPGGDSRCLSGLQDLRRLVLISDRVAMESLTAGPWGTAFLPSTGLANLRELEVRVHTSCKGMLRAAPFLDPAAQPNCESAAWSDRAALARL